MSAYSKNILKSMQLDYSNRTSSRKKYIQFAIYYIYVIAVLYDLLHLIGILGPYVIFVLQYIVAEVLINMPYVPVTFYNLGKAVGRITNSSKVWYAKRDIIII